MRKFTLGSRFYYSRLTESEQKTYRKIYDSWIDGGSVAEFTMAGKDFALPTGLQLDTLVHYIIQDNPQLFHLEKTHFKYERNGDHITIITASVYTQSQYEQIYSRLITKVDAIVAKANQYKTDYEKLRFLHDYLVKSVTYKLDNSSVRANRETHTIVGPLLNGSCVCDGYARAFRLLCDQLKLSCIVVSGDGFPGRDTKKTERHAWNFVRLNGRVYHVDVTWDSNCFRDKLPFYDYYFLRNDRIFAKEHRWDPKLFPPIE